MSGCVTDLPSAVRRTMYRPGAACGPFVEPPQRIIPGKDTAGEYAPSHANVLRPAPRGGLPPAPAPPRPRPPPPPPAAPAPAPVESAGAPPRPPRPPAFVVSG